jgi:cyclohexadieny/prephenate dehydrogenase
MAIVIKKKGGNGKIFPPPFTNISIIGTGLIGASILRAIKLQWPDIQISAYDINKKSLQIMINDGLVDIVHENIEQLGNTDLVIISTPGSKVISILSKLIPFLKNGAVITDIASVKKEILSRVSDILPKKNYYISSHPMAGGSSPGPAESRANLFENRSCILIPINNPPDEKIDAISKFWIGLGANPGLSNAEQHDIAVALTSHLPHLIAFSMINVLGQQFSDLTHQLFVGRSILDLVRLGSANPVIWQDIFYMNRVEILNQLSIFEATLQSWKNALRTNSESEISLEIQKVTSIRNCHNFFLSGESHD